MKDYVNNLKPELIIVDEKGTLSIKHNISPWSILLIEKIN